MGLHLNEGGDDLAENHEINVTPFIDVMLVLLIIFMVAAPWPRSTSRSTCPPRPPNRRQGRRSRCSSASRPTRSCTSATTWWLQPDQLGAMLDAKTKGDKETTIFFQADKGVDYGDLMEVMNNMRAAGYLKVGLVGLETAAKK
jgi:biopolymer transport protein ExbD